ncbi:hypothetical protein TNCV_2586071 [Trichonephila clavipes]|nr:hypothetical protein TNCV_2586071 [Trichonephila clavipes]
MVVEQLARHHKPVTTVDELWYRVEVAWCSVPVHAIQSRFDSMPRRIRAVITARRVPLLPSTSSVTVTLSSESQPPIPLTDTTPAIFNSLSISAASSSFIISIITPLPACPILETTTTTSNTIPATSQVAKENFKPRRKRRPPENTSNTIKLKIEFKMAMKSMKHMKSAPVKYTTDEEDMIVYDVWKMSLNQIQIM